jgi:hypothetical protein
MVQKILAQLESLAKNWQLKYMSGRRTTEVITDGRILFHPGHSQEKIMIEYQKRLKKINLK